MNIGTMQTVSMQYQRGVVIVVSLIILLLMTLVSVTAMRTTILEEKMAGNSRDQNTAFQMAELGLLDGENDLNENSIDLAGDYKTDCTNGLCLSDGWTDKPWESIDWNDDTYLRTYGDETGASDVPDIAKQPRYIIEKITGSPPGRGGESLGVGRTYQAADQGIYRITVQGFGATRNNSGTPLARIMLQSTYKMTN